MLSVTGPDVTLFRFRVVPATTPVTRLLERLTASPLTVKSASCAAMVCSRRTEHETSPSALFSPKPSSPASVTSASPSSVEPAVPDTSTRLISRLAADPVSSRVKTSSLSSFRLAVTSVFRPAVVSAALIRLTVWAREADTALMVIACGAPPSTVMLNVALLAEKSKPLDSALLPVTVAAEPSVRISRLWSKPASAVSSCRKSSGATASTSPAAKPLATSCTSIAA